VATRLAAGGCDSATGLARAALAVGAGAMTVSRDDGGCRSSVSRFPATQVERGWVVHAPGTAVAGFTNLACAWPLAPGLGLGLP